MDDKTKAQLALEIVKTLQKEMSSGELKDMPSVRIVEVLRYMEKTFHQAIAREILMESLSDPDMHKDR